MPTTPRREDALQRVRQLHPRLARRRVGLPNLPCSGKVIPQRTDK